MAQFIIDPDTPGDEDYESFEAAINGEGNPTSNTTYELRITSGSPDPGACQIDNADGGYTQTFMPYGTTGMADHGSWPTAFLTMGGNTARVIQTAATNDCFRVHTDLVIIEGLILETTRYCVHINDKDVDGTIVRNNYMIGGTHGVVLGSSADQNGKTCYIYRNVVCNMSAEGINNSSPAASSYYVEHNTVFNCGTVGINSTNATPTLYLRNNRAGTCGTSCYSGAWDTKTNNVSDDATGDTGMTAVAIGAGIYAPCMFGIDAHLAEEDQRYPDDVLAGELFDRASGTNPFMTGGTAGTSFVSTPTPPGSQTYWLSVAPNTSLYAATFIRQMASFHFYFSTCANATLISDFGNGDNLVQQNWYETSEHSPLEKWLFRKTWGGAFQFGLDGGASFAITGTSIVEVYGEWTAGTTFGWYHRVDGGSWSARHNESVPNSAERIRSIRWGGEYTGTAGRFYIGKWCLAESDPTNGQSDDPSGYYATGTNTQYTGTGLTTTAGTMDLDGDTVDSFDCGADERDWSAAGAQNLSVNPVSFVLESPAASVAAGPVNLDASPVSVVIDAPAASLAASVGLSAGTSSFVLEAPAASIAAGPVTLTVTPVAFVLEAPAASIATGGSPQGLSVNPVSLVFEAPAATIDSAINLTAGTVSLVFEVAAASIAAGPVELTVTPASVVLSAPSASISVASGPQSITATTISFVIGAPAATISSARLLTANAVTVSLSAPAATLSASVTLAATTASVVLEGPAASLLPGGVTLSVGVAQFVLQAPAATIAVPQNLTVNTVTITLVAPAASLTSFVTHYRAVLHITDDRPELAVIDHKPTLHVTDDRPALGVPFRGGS